MTAEAPRMPTLPLVSAMPPLLPVMVEFLTVTPPVPVVWAMAVPFCEVTVESATSILPVVSSMPLFTAVRFVFFRSTSPPVPSMPVAPVIVTVEAFVGLTMTLPVVPVTAVPVPPRTVAPDPIST